MKIKMCSFQKVKRNLAHCFLWNHSQSMRLVCSVTASAPRIFYCENYLPCSLINRFGDLFSDCVITCFRVRANKFSVAKRLTPDNHKQALGSLWRTRLRNGKSAGSSGTPDLVHGANEKNSPDNAVAFATRLPIGKTGISRRR